ncbi:FAD/NAD(P)-binding protein [Pseudogemmobacter sonorensis]|uniref:FAD/NAD(P)-binding protein n=1 Tax=Pseudogemmobacter sonorensis TaxID=2989681 RepID=UPI003698B95E
MLILGGGASGVLMAAHLLAQEAAGFRVTLVEGRNRPGRGLAYSTPDPDHLLNTRVHSMSAYPADPHHFHRGLKARPEGAGVTDRCFVSRATYGAYLSDLLRPWADPRLVATGQAEVGGSGASSSASAPEFAPQPHVPTPPQASRSGAPASGAASAAGQTFTGGRLRFLAENCTSLTERADGVAAGLEGGRSLMGDYAVLATGHVLPSPDPEGLLSDAWAVPEGIDPEARVVILGSGLSMVDQVLTLLKSGHRGEIVALSRRGQLPRPHASGTPLAVAAEEVPFGAPVSRLWAWARGLARRAEAQGGTWRDAVDGIRPHVQALWRALPDDARARFLRHGATWWDVHRHRIPPASEARLSGAFLSGQLRLLRGAWRGVDRGGEGGIAVSYRPRGNSTTETIAAALVIDCRGIRRDPLANASPLIGDLLARGAARIDPLSIGLDVDADCHVVGRDGRPSRRIHAIGPVSRAAFWEITAIPDIRVQTEALARRFAGAAVPA